MRAEISNRPILRGRIHIPAWGIWWADVETGQTGEPELAGEVTISLNDLELSGTIISPPGTFRGRVRHRVAGGAGGWGRSVAARSWTNDAGVRRGTVLSATAQDAGEQLELATVSGTTGSHYVRAEGPAARVLHDLYPQSWHVDLGGVTRAGSWPETDYQGDATITDRTDLAAGRLELAPFGVADLLPGAQIAELRAVDVIHHIEPQADGPRLRTDVWGAQGASSRLPSAVQDLVDALTAQHRYRGAFSYRVVAQQGERLDLQPERASSGLPDLLRVPVRLAPGLSVGWPLGSLVLLVFVGGDPGRPAVISGDDPDSPGFYPGSVKLDASALNEVLLGDGLGRVLREGDTLSLTNVLPGPVPPAPPSTAQNVTAIVTFGLPLPSRVKA